MVVVADERLGAGGCTEAVRSGEWRQEITQEGVEGLMYSGKSKLVYLVDEVFWAGCLFCGIDRWESAFPAIRVH